MQYKEKFQHRLSQILEELLSLHGDAYRYLLTYALDGGKQIRPVLFLEVLQQWKQDITDDDIEVASALELLHIFFLIHDDVMDDDEMRRDKLTLHAHFLREGMQDGVGRAVVWGDILFCKALQLLAKHRDKKLALALTQTMLDVAEETAQGQLLEANRATLPEIMTLLTFYAKKTALYSVYLPVYAAALLSGKEDAQRDIQIFASDLGIAFQLYDDLSEFSGEKKRQEHTSRCGDIMRLKATPLLVETIPLLSPALQESVRKKYHTNELITVEEEAEIIRTMSASGVVKNACLQISKYAQKAKSTAESLDISEIPVVERLLDKYLVLAESHIAQV